MSTQITQAVIFAGGRGERLKPLTDTIPKPMIPIDSRPFLERFIELLRQNGIEEILLLLGYLPEKIMDYFGDGSRFGVKISYHVGKPEDLTAKRVWSARHLLHDYFLLTCCDNYWPAFNLETLWQEYKKRGAPVLATVYDNRVAHGEYGPYANMLVEDGFVTYYGTGTLALDKWGLDTGFFIASKEIVGRLNESPEMMWQEFTKSLIPSRELAAHVTDQPYFVLTNHYELSKTEKFFREKKDHAIPSGSTADVNMSSIEKEKIAREILRLRLSQMIVNEEYKAGKFKIPIHLAFGHEALAVAVSAVMREEDKLLLSHRNIAYNLARASLRKTLDEYFLKPSGLAAGRFGSMNLINPSAGIVYTSSILGNQFPVAVGVSLGGQILGERGIVIVQGGDGAIEEGAFYESMLMAKSLGVAALFLIENNEWSMATKIEERRTAINLRSLTNSLGLEYTYLEGNDPYLYREELARLRDILCREKSPRCAEVKVTTLGDWKGPVSPQYPEGKFINYHHGPTPSVALSSWPLIKESDEDPVWALKKHFSEEELRAMAKEELEIIQKEIA